MDSGDDNVQSVLIVSACENDPSSVVKLILDQEGLPVTCETLADGVASYPWHISTKYYETDVTLHTLSAKTLLPQNLAEGVQAVIVIFDSSKNDALARVEGWQSFLKDYEVDISILICQRCLDSSPSGVSKLAAQEWCVEHGYELVELEPQLDEDWAEQDFQETLGIQRVVQALHAHLWPNLTLKDRREPTSVSGLLHGGEIESEMSHLDLSLNTADTSPADLAADHIEQRLDELLGCGSETDFYELFGDLASMKERMSTLPNDQRKACAEQVVLAFWRAIGGDAEEIDDQPPP